MSVFSRQDDSFWIFFKFTTFPNNFHRPNIPMKKNEKVTFTPSKYAALIGIDRASLTRRLSEQNAKPVSADGRGTEYSLRDLHNAATGGNQAAERLRKLRGEADRIEHDLAVRRRDFISVDLVKKLGTAVVFEVRRTILASDLPPDLQDKCLTEIHKLKDLDWREACEG